MPLVIGDEGHRSAAVADDNGVAGGADDIVKLDCSVFDLAVQSDDVTGLQAKRFSVHDLGTCWYYISAILAAERCDGVRCQRLCGVLWRYNSFPIGGNQFFIGTTDKTRKDRAGKYQCLRRVAKSVG